MNYFFHVSMIKRIILLIALITIIIIFTVLKNRHDNRLQILQSNAEDYILAKEYRNAIKIWNKIILEYSENSSIYHKLGYAHLQLAASGRL